MGEHGGRSVLFFSLLTLLIPFAFAEGEACTTNANCFCADLCNAGSCDTVTANPLCKLPGDLHDDREITCYDVRCVQEYLLGGSTAWSGLNCQHIWTCGDVYPIGSPNGQIDENDLLTIRSLATQNGYNCPGDASNGYTGNDPPGTPSNPQACVTAQCDDETDNDLDGQIDWNGYVSVRRIFSPDAECSGRSDNTEQNPPPPQCNDGIDNDADDLVDYPADWGCIDAADTFEIDPQCRDGLDNDGDGFIDHTIGPLNDIGCDSLNDDSEFEQCQDRIDNDGDGLIDDRGNNPRRLPDDPGCASRTDNNEHGDNQCDDGLDNDNDGTTDLDDAGCGYLTDISENPACVDGIDNDGDGRVDFGDGSTNDPGCAATSDGAETNSLIACDDGLDNDNDGQIDQLDIGCDDHLDLSEQNPACSDGINNDGDGQIDYPADAGCEGVYDQDEREQCQDLRDNDGDGLFDYLATSSRLSYQDPGCSAPTDTSERGTLACDDGTDNDGDGQIDLGDLGCMNAYDPSEVTPHCTDGIDNDGDTFTDYPADPGCDRRLDDAETDDAAECDNALDDDGDGKTDFGPNSWNDPECTSPNDVSELPACDDGHDNDGDGLVDYTALPDLSGRQRSDPGCTDLSDNSEHSVNLICDNGIDDDADGLSDYPRDLGCWDSRDMNEANPACADGIDNDGGGETDWPNDLGCTSFQDTSEFDTYYYKCDNGIDDDGDGFIDAADTGCQEGDHRGDADEVNYACNDAIDNDGDGVTDYREDEGCFSADDKDEHMQHGSNDCDDGLDNDDDGLADWNIEPTIGDPGCGSQRDGSERAGGLNIGRFYSQCDDPFDNDHDGYVSFPEDPGCTGPRDSSEKGSAQCDNGRDDDSDGKTDYRRDTSLRDPGCTSPRDESEIGGGTNECNDGSDNDGDGKIDYPQDPGCKDSADNWERTGYACDDGIDNEQIYFGGSTGDGFIDYPQDPGCVAVTDINEMLGTACDDGRDNDWPADGLRDLQDPGCADVFDNSERDGASGEPDCDDGGDNDRDGEADFPDDPGCYSSLDDNEYDDTECDNGIDDDGDGQFADHAGIDLNGDGDFLDPGEYGPEPGCTDSDDPSELDPHVACDNGYDDDDSGTIDWPDDFGCITPWDSSELSSFPNQECDDGRNNDLDGLPDMDDPGCSNEADLLETSTAQCDNGIDDSDADLLADWPRDLGCENPADTSEDDGGVSSCDDGIKNQDETDVDCGGSCEPCVDGLRCGTSPTADQNCLSGICENGICESCREDGQDLAKSNHPPECTHCTDGVKTPGTDETDKDCGGADCEPCLLNQLCAQPRDCGEGLCASTAGGPLRCTEAEHCNDGFQNNRESDLDCGGGECKDCRMNQRCTTTGDCKSGSCVQDVDLDGIPSGPSLCAGPIHCIDNFHNADETDKNCGGADCRGCPQGDKCSTNADCAYHLCVPNAGGPGVNLCSTCRPLFPNHNDVSPGNTRVDVYLKGVNYGTTPTLFLTQARKAVDLRSEFPERGLAELAVYKDNLNKFNFWYFPKLFPPLRDVSACTSETCVCIASCLKAGWVFDDADALGPNSYCAYTEPNREKRIIPHLCNWACKPSTALQSQLPTNFPMRRPPGIPSYPQSEFANSFDHEFQHTFAELRDEYAANSQNIFNPGQPNCAATRSIGENWWGDLTTGEDDTAEESINGNYLRTGYFNGCGGNVAGGAYVKPTQSSLMNGDFVPELGIRFLTDFRLGAVNRRCVQQRINQLTGGPVTNYACGFG